MTIKITRRFVIEFSATSLVIGIPYVGQICFGRQLTELDHWKTLRNADHVLAHENR